MRRDTVARLDRTVGMAEEEEGEPTTLSSATTSGNRADFTFDPSTSSPVPQCQNIQFIQSIQITGDGTPIKPSTFYSGWAYRDPTAISDATFIDHLSTFRTPYLAENGHGTSGHANGGTANATFSDTPDATGGGDKGFKSAANPTGWSTIVYNFQTLAFCTAGTDCGQWYDGIQWDYTKTDADHAAGSSGTSTGTGSLAGPGSSTLDAFDQFNNVKGFTPCMSSVAPGP